MVNVGSGGGTDVGGGIRCSASGVVGSWQIEV